VDSEGVKPASSYPKIAFMRVTINSRNAPATNPITNAGIGATNPAAGVIANQASDGTGNSRLRRWVVRSDSTPQHSNVRGRRGREMRRHKSAGS